MSNVKRGGLDLTLDQIRKLVKDLELSVKTGFAPAFPDTTLNFSDYIKAFPSLRKGGWAFGTGLAEADGAKDAEDRIVIKSFTELRKHFEAQGSTINVPGLEFNPGFGYDFVARDFGTQSPQAGSALSGCPEVHTFRADSLRMHPVVQYGRARIYLTTQLAAAGIIVNSKTTNTETPIANFGAVVGDLASISVGHSFTVAKDRFFIKGKSGTGLVVEAASAVTFAAPADGATFTYAPNASISIWAVQFSSLCIARVAAGTPILHGTKGPYAMATPIPADIVAGCSVKWAQDTSKAFQTRGHLRIESIDRSGGNHTFTLDQNIVNNPYNGLMGVNSLVMFAPCIWSPVMATLESQGPLDCGVYAAKLRVTMPDCEVTDVVDTTYSASGIQAWLTAHPKAALLLGLWFAFWFNKVDYGTDRVQSFMNGSRLINRRDEMDKFGEFFHQFLGGGGNVWTGAIHQRGTHRTIGDNYMPSYDGFVYWMGQLLAPVLDVGTKSLITELLMNFFTATRTRVVNAARTGWRLPGSKWVEQTEGYPSYHTGNKGGVLNTDGAHKLVLPDAHRIFNGAPVELAIVWTRRWCVAYLFDIPICVTEWNITDQEQPYTMILDLLLHTTDSWASEVGFLCRDTDNVPASFIDVHSIDTYRGA